MPYQTSPGEKPATNANDYNNKEEVNEITIKGVSHKVFKVINRQSLEQQKLFKQEVNKKWQKKKKL